MTLIARLNARLGLAAGLLGLAIALPAVTIAVTPAPAEARAGGSYGSTRSSAGSSSRSSFSGSRSSSTRYRGARGGDPFTGFPAIPPFLFGVLGVGAFAAFVLVSKGRVDTSGMAPSARLSQDTSELLAELAERDAVWREDAFLQQARDAFEAVQRAWVSRNQDQAKGVMTPALYQRHKAQTDAMIARGEKPVMEQLQILAARVVYVGDRVDDAQDEAWVQFTGGAVDYLIREATGEILRGDATELSVFKEIWKFKRHGRQWRVDAIDPNTDQVLPLSFSEPMSA
jgi:hypothetical protein